RARRRLAAVDAEDLDAPGVCRAQVECAFDESRLSRAVGAHQPGRRAWRDLQADPVQRAVRAEALHQSFGMEGSNCRGSRRHSGDTIILPSVTYLPAHPFLLWPL